LEFIRARFWTVNKDAEKSMREWIKVVRKIDWKTSADTKATFNPTNVYKNCTIFDVGGNKIALLQRLNIKHTSYLFVLY
jgi:mRNA-degrading endonuclease HigB of HigAB toxin-antitoxin module